MTNRVISLGSDPELIVVKGDKPISAIPLFKGTKHEPEKVPFGIISHDNVNVEFGIDPALDEASWVKNTREVLVKTISMLPAEMKLMVEASTIWPETELNLPEAKAFGCDPDYNAYELCVNTPPEDAAKSPLRSCGGHIHVGNEEIASDAWHVIGLAKAMDVFLGVPSLLLDKDPSSGRRRALYGQASCHRPKPYGLEYRALGNFWVSSERLARLVYKLSIAAVNSYLDGHMRGINEEAIRSIINSGDVDTASKIVNGLVKGLLPKSTFDEVMDCAKLPRTSIYEGWTL